MHRVGDTAKETDRCGVGIGQNFTCICEIFFGALNRSLDFIWIGEGSILPEPELYPFEESNG